MLSSGYWHLYFWKNNFPRYWRELDAFRSMSPAETRRQMGARLLAQLRYFGDRADALPEWREAAHISDVDTLWRVWPSLPVVTKRDLVTRFHPREMAPRF